MTCCLIYFNELLRVLVLLLCSMCTSLPGLLDEHTLRRCPKVCRHWQHLAQETMEEIKFRRIFQDQIKAMMKVEHLYVCMI